MSGVYSGTGALNVTLNDTTTLGSYMPDGSLRVTDAAGPGVYDGTGAMRINSAAGLGVYINGAIHYESASGDAYLGVYTPWGALRMLTSGVAPGTITYTADHLILSPLNPNGYRVGIATIGGSGTPVWSLSSNPGGKYAIDSSTGIITMATSPLTTGTDAITISVTGVTPSASDLPVNITVAMSADYSQPGNAGYVPH